MYLLAISLHVVLEAVILNIVCIMIYLSSYFSFCVISSTTGVVMSIIEMVYAICSFAMSEAAGSWLALMDRFLSLRSDNVEEKNLVKKNILQLIDIYYDALDAPKIGGKVSMDSCFMLHRLLYPFARILMVFNCYFSIRVIY